MQPLFRPSSPQVAPSLQGDSNQHPSKAGSSGQSPASPSIKPSALESKIGRVRPTSLQNAGGPSQTPRIKAIFPPGPTEQSLSTGQLSASAALIAQMTRKRNAAKIATGKLAKSQLQKSRLSNEVKPDDIAEPQKKKYIRSRYIDLSPEDRAFVDSDDLYTSSSETSSAASSDSEMEPSRLSPKPHQAANDQIKS